MRWGKDRMQDRYRDEQGSRSDRYSLSISCGNKDNNMCRGHVVRPPDKYAGGHSQYGLSIGWGLVRQPP